jgi:hypothetical protein
VRDAAGNQTQLQGMVYTEIWLLCDGLRSWWLVAHVSNCGSRFHEHVAGIFLNRIQVSSLNLAYKRILPTGDGKLIVSGFYNYLNFNIGTI